MTKLGPVGISVILCSSFLLVAVVGFRLASGGGSDSGATAATQPFQGAQQPGTHATGEVLSCPGGGQAATSFNQVGGEFRLVGRLASIDSTRLLVKGPQQYITMNVAPGAQIDSSLQGGQIVKASGAFDQNGEANVTAVQPVCSAPAVVAQVAAAPTQAAAPTPTQAVVMTLAPTPRPTAVLADHVTVQTTRPVVNTPPRPTSSPEGKAQLAGEPSHGKPGKDEPEQNDD